MSKVREYIVTLKRKEWTLGIFSYKRDDGKYMASFNNALNCSLSYNYCKPFNEIQISK